MPSSPSEVVAGFTAALSSLTAVALVWVEAPQWALWTLIVVAVIVQRYVASGYANASALSVIDMVYTAVPNPSAKATSALLRFGSTPFTSLEKTAPLKDKVCLVTGCTVGSIGFWTAVLLVRLGATVVVTCRSRIMANSAKGHVLRAAQSAGGTFAPERVVALDLELGSSRSVVDFANAMKRAGVHRLDFAVHNAGVLVTRASSNWEAGEPNFMCNVVGTLALADGLTPLMTQTAAAHGVTTRHVFLSSVLHASVPHGGRGAAGIEAMAKACLPSRSEGGSPVRQRDRPTGMAAYGLSKLGGVAMASTLQRELDGTGVSATAVHPGCALTDIMRDMPAFLLLLARTVGPLILGLFFKSSLEAAFTTVAACLDRDHRETPLYWVDSQPTEPSPLARDRRLCDAIVLVAREEAQRQKDESTA